MFRMPEHTITPTKKMSSLRYPIAISKSAMSSAIHASYRLEPANVNPFIMDVVAGEYRRKTSSVSRMSNAAI
jgi:hypothetical protein